MCSRFLVSNASLIYKLVFLKLERHIIIFRTSELEGLYNGFIKLQGFSFLSARKSLLLLHFSYAPQVDKGLAWFLWLWHSVYIGRFECIFDVCASRISPGDPCTSMKICLATTWRPCLAISCLPWRPPLLQALTSNILLSFQTISCCHFWGCLYPSCRFLNRPAISDHIAGLAFVSSSRPQVFHAVYCCQLQGFLCQSCRYSCISQTSHSDYQTAGLSMLLIFQMMISSCQGICYLSRRFFITQTNHTSVILIVEFVFFFYCLDDICAETFVSFLLYPSTTIASRFTCFLIKQYWCCHFLRLFCAFLCRLMLHDQDGYH